MANLLEGVKVLDQTNVLSGPFCSNQLAQLGAEVIKVEVPGSGDLARQFGTDPELSRRRMGTGFVSQNAGKKSITLNLKDPEGRKIFRELVAQSDVLLENFRPGVMKRLGLGAEVLQEINPRLIYCAISGFGQDGPMRDNPAYDQIIQGLSGIMSITGDAESAPLRVGFPICDTVGGLTAAFAISAALFRRSQTGAGEIIDLSLLEATLVAMGWAVGGYLLTGKPPRPHGNENSTASPSGAFHTADGLLNISANKDEQFRALCQMLDLPELADNPLFINREARMKHRAALKAEMEAVLVTRGAAEWEKLLNDAHVPAGRVLAVPQILEHGQITSRGFVQHIDHVPGIDRGMDAVRCGFRLASGDPAVGGPPPQLGDHTAEVLGALGYGEADLQALKEKGVI